MPTAGTITKWRAQVATFAMTMLMVFCSRQFFCMVDIFIRT